MNRRQETQIEHFSNHSIFQPKTKFQKFSSEFSFSNFFLRLFDFVFLGLDLLVSGFFTKNFAQNYKKKFQNLIFRSFQIDFFLSKFGFSSQCFKISALIIIFSDDYYFKRFLLGSSLFRISSLVEEGNVRSSAEKMADFGGGGK